MKAESLINLLASEFGRDAVIVNTQHHIQVKAAGDRKHDVWLTKFGGMKWRLAHSRQTAEGSPEKMIQRMKDCAAPSHRSDYEAMKEALSLGSLIGQAERFAKAEHVTRIVYCDAGFKNGRARIGVVMLDGDVVKAESRGVTAATVSDAERIAIQHALDLAPAGFTIYSDNKGCVESIADPRVKWIPREQNKCADRIANLRTA